MLDDYPKEVELRDGENAFVRIATREDQTRLMLFFLTIPEEERDFLPYDLADQESLQGWFGGPNWEEAFPLIAEVDGRIMGAALLKCYTVSWRQHIGDTWMMVNENMRGLGLGRLLQSEVFSMAAQLGITKMTASVRADALGALRILKQLGYTHEGVLTDYVKDREGQTHDIALMACNIKEYFRRLEDQRQETAIMTDIYNI